MIYEHSTILSGVIWLLHSFSRMVVVLSFPSVSIACLVSGSLSLKQCPAQVSAHRVSLNFLKLAWVSHTCNPSPQKLQQIGVLGHFPQHIR